MTTEELIDEIWKLSGEDYGGLGLTIYQYPRHSLASHKNYEESIPGNPHPWRFHLRLNLTISSSTNTGLFYQTDDLDEGLTVILEWLKRFGYQTLINSGDKVSLGHQYV